MPDDRSKRGGQDRTHIDVSEPCELRDWSNEFGVSEDEPKEAVRSVGDQVAAVSQHLKARRASNWVQFRLPHPREVSRRELAAIVRNTWLVAIALLIAACAATPGDKGSATQHKRDKLEGVPLVWKPTNRPGSLNVTEFAGAAEVKVQIDPIADTRQNPGLLGENRGRDTARKVTTPDNVAAFVTDKFRMLMYQSGIDVVNSGATAIIRPDLRSFYVDELYTYRGDVRIGVTVIDPSGKVLWRGIAAGSMGRFGRSYKADNYYETLSDSLIDAVDNLLKNPAFLRSLSGQGATEQS